MKFLVGLVHLKLHFTLFKTTLFLIFKILICSINDFKFVYDENSNKMMYLILTNYIFFKSDLQYSIFRKFSK